MGRGFGISAAVDHDVVRAVAADAEAIGYSSLWVNDLPHADGLASLAAAAEVTDRIRLGIGVVPLDRRPPGPIVDRVRELGLPLDRLWLGVGSGEAGDALATVRDGVGHVRGALDVAVVVGALGPRMAALGGEVADGVLLNWLTPEHASRLRRGVRDGTVMAYVRCALLPQGGERLRQEIARYAGVGSFERHVARMGARPEDTCVVGADGDALRRGLERFDGPLDETIVRAITPDDGRAPITELLLAAAPTPP